MGKICKKCGNYGEFTPDRRNSDGLQSTCKKCYNLSRSIRYHSDEQYRDKQRNHQKKYNKTALVRVKKAVQYLPDHYIIKELRRGTDLTVEDIKGQPELIELKRQVIKNKRLCQTLKTSSS